jgi:hypothetical protein
VTVSRWWNPNDSALHTGASASISRHLPIAIALSGFSDRIPTSQDHLPQVVAVLFSESLRACRNPGTASGERAQQTASPQAPGAQRAPTLTSHRAIKIYGPSCQASSKCYSRCRKVVMCARWPCKSEPLPSQSSHSSRRRSSVSRGEIY